jgi:hypothetical protein
MIGVTVIEVDSAVHDLLARIAAEQGRSIGALLADMAAEASAADQGEPSGAVGAKMAAETLTAEERHARAEAARQYFRDVFGQEVTDEGLAEARALLNSVAARKVAK